MPQGNQHSNVTESNATTPEIWYLNDGKFLDSGLVIGPDTPSPESEQEQTEQIEVNADEGEPQNVPG